MTVRAVSPALAIAVLVGTTITASAQPLSRAEAVAQAITAHPQVKLALEQVAVLEGRITEARADALPDLSWSMRALRSRDPGLLNTPNFDSFPAEFRAALRPIPGNMFDAYAAVQQTLFSFKLGHAVGAAKLAREAGDEQVRFARQTIALQAIHGYNDLLFALEQLRVARSAIEQKEAHVNVARSRRSAGVATELDVLRVEVDLENERAALFRAETQVAAARARLNTIMLRPIDSAVEPTDSFSVEPVASTFEAAVEEALASRPELQSLRLELQVRDRLIDVSRAEMKPRVDLTAGYGFSARNPRDLADLDFARWSAAVTATIPVFDGHRTAGRIAQGLAERNVVAQRIAALENQVRLDVQALWDSLLLAERTLAAADLNVAQARRAVDMTEANYRLGTATPLDVLDAQQALVLAEDIRNQALLTRANSRASLSFVMGRDPLTDGRPAAPAKR
ncbi:MAG: TolC family protein [Acidobacteria bacterium]|nr:TolC family protein [Acidobacteriota bacterium]